MFTALLDTCVLWPSLQRDVLLSFAAEGLYRPAWSSAILAELEHSEAAKLRRHGESDQDAATRAAHLIRQMRAAFDDAETVGWEGLDGTYGLPDPDDEHVIAGSRRRRCRRHHHPEHQRLPRRPAPRRPRNPHPGTVRAQYRLPRPGPRPAGHPQHRPTIRSPRSASHRRRVARPPRRPLPLRRRRRPAPFHQLTPQPKRQRCASTERPAAALMPPLRGATSFGRSLAPPRLRDLLRSRIPSIRAHPPQRGPRVDTG